MGLLVISYKNEYDEIAMNNIIGRYESAARAKYFDREEEAITYVAHLDGWNIDPVPFRHFFIYPDAKCLLKCASLKNCIPLSEIDLDLKDAEGGIPEHLKQIYEREVALEAEAAKVARAVAGFWFTND